VIAVDTNLLVYAHHRTSPFHAKARASVLGLAEGTSAWAIPWPCLHEFYGVVTHPRIYTPPTPSSDAIDQIEAWLESPSLVLLSESPAHWPALKDLLTRARVQGPAVHDARIAALCLQHGVKTLWSADRDFARFAPLHVVNPLVV
jgi:uncharacterized protein